jgi:hypothetical protein
MRQPAIATLQATIDPAPALRSLLAAIPDDRLRELTLEILLASLTAAPASARAKAPVLPPPAPAPAAKRSRG